MESIAIVRAPGPITGHGTGWKRAVRMFTARQKQLARVGRWRAGTNNQQYKGDGVFIDPDYYIVDWSMVLFDEGQGVNIMEECNAVL